MKHLVRIVLTLLVTLFMSSSTASAIFTAEPLTSSQQDDSPCVFPQLYTIIKNNTDILYTLSCDTTVSGILHDAKLKEQEWYSEQSEFKNTHTISIVSARKKTEVTWVTIPFPTESEYTKELPHRARATVQQGKTGVKGVLTETITLTNGERRENIISQWVETEPVIEKIKIGTKYDLQTVEIEGKVIHYWKSLTVLATSYDKTCLGCDSWTATGAYLTKGIVAVDPKVIPLHTSMYIPGYGFGKAEDTGGAVKGDKIDLGFDDLRQGGWSRRWVTIYIID